MNINIYNCNQRVREKREGRDAHDIKHLEEHTTIAIYDYNNQSSPRARPLNLAHQQSTRLAFPDFEVVVLSRSTIHQLYGNKIVSSVNKELETLSLAGGIRAMACILVSTTIVIYLFRDGGVTI